MIRVLGIFQLFLVIVRIILDVLNYVPAGKCVYHSLPVEKCGHTNLLPPKLSANLNTYGAILEAVNTFALLLVILRWKLFHGKNFFCAILRIGHFWVWFLLCFTYIISVLYVDLIETKTDQNVRLSALGIGLIFETFLLTFFASAINFIARETYLRWVESRFPCQDKWQRLFCALYRLVLVSYLARNLGMFLYDTALVALSISVVKGQHIDGKNGWDSLLLVLNVAFRGSFVKFFFAKIFQGQHLPQVCENVLEQEYHHTKRSAEYRVIDATREPSIINANAIYYGGL
ncbi:predicted protein [Nematostella vectensis]|uniref:Uncharacterized protein n=1 Tax=Nematostella vectensis TaxID=45351 RepID=A7SRN7_NEMVE|nr:uncharacterized protein LOC116612466 [Nematostella vectensis]EDO33615.1 predicted protein [Nematostella vectensis]|eukprot:XP_001625715.1 predicted protein [Nematostella vectensis]